MNQKKRNLLFNAGIKEFDEVITFCVCFDIIKKESDLLTTSPNPLNESED